MKIKEEQFSTTNNEIKLFVLENKLGTEVKISNYGGIITSWSVVDSLGNKRDIVLGFSSYEAYRTEQYLNACPYFGAIVGRYANRIGKGTFTLDNQKYELAINNGENHLHGGLEGFDKKIWQAETQITENEATLVLSYLSADCEENYPGNLQVKVEYILNNQNELKVKYHATTDKKTVLNLTQHSYFNLKGEGNSTVLEHEIQIFADKFTLPDANLIPTGETPSLENHPLNLQKLTKIGENIRKVGGNGYDHNYILTKKENELSLAARVIEPESKLSLEVYTTKPGIQFYTGNFLDGSLKGKSGKIYPAHAGFCLETQFFPDSPNKPLFPSSQLNPDEVYEHETIFKIKS